MLAISIMRLSSTIIQLSVLMNNHLRVVVGSDERLGLHIVCQNGSSLMKGDKNYANIFSEDMILKIPFLQETTKYDGYCECGSTGFTGIDCSIPYEKCRDDSICFHGAPCVLDFSNKEKYHCACPQTTYPVDGSFVGDSCEYQVTSYCDKVPLMDDEFDEYVFDDSDVSTNGEWYCANGGECRNGIS